MQSQATQFFKFLGGASPSTHQNHAFGPQMPLRQFLVFGAVHVLIIVVFLKYKKRTVEEWKDFIFTDECTECFFQLPNAKNDAVCSL